MGFKVAVVGATGNVGREMLNILAERRFPADEVVALASRKSMGVEVSFGDKTLKCKTLDHYEFSDVDICLMSAGGEVSCLVQFGCSCYSSKAVVVSLAKRVSAVQRASVESCGALRFTS